MNVISYEMAYSLYPRATFEEDRGLILRTVGPSQLAGIAKYTERGWDMIYNVPEDERANERSFKEGSRWIDDAASWCIPLCRTPAEHKRFTTFHPTPTSPPIRRDPASVTNWYFRFREDEPEMCFGTVKSIGLFYPYVIHEWVVEENLKTIYTRLVRRERERARTEGELHRRAGSENWE